MAVELIDFGLVQPQHYAVMDSVMYDIWYVGLCKCKSALTIISSTTTAKWTPIPGV